MRVRSGVTKKPKVPRPSIRAAQYAHVSTDMQEYSTRSQADAIAIYAACHDVEIVRTFADGGRSGLKFSEFRSLRGRSTR
jgi:DNA invertase Pin-like site-specific DNA recombinase